MTRIIPIVLLMLTSACASIERFEQALTPQTPQQAQAWAHGLNGMAGQLDQYQLDRERRVNAYNQQLFQRQQAAQPIYVQPARQPAAMQCNEYCQMLRQQAMQPAYGY